MKMSYSYLLIFICINLGAILVNAAGWVPNAGVAATDINPFTLTLFIGTGVIATLIGGLLFGFGGQIVALGFLITGILSVLNTFLGIPAIITSIAKNTIPTTDSLYGLFAGATPVIPLIFSSLTAFIFFFFLAEIVTNRNITY